MQHEKECLLSKLSEAERDGAAAAREIHALKSTIERLNVVGVGFFVLAFAALFCFMALLKKILLQLLIQRNVRS